MMKVRTKLQRNRCKSNTSKDCTLKEIMKILDSSKKKRCPKNPGYSTLYASQTQEFRTNNTQKRKTC